MKTQSNRTLALRRLPVGEGARKLWWLLPLVLLAILPGVADATVPVPPPGSGSTNSDTALERWSFSNTTTWTNDHGYAPIAFTNLNWSPLGNGPALLVDSTNAAFLQYNIFEPDGATNLTVDQGSVMFWVAPASWTGTNAGGTGPGVWGRLIEAGSYTPDASYGWWSLYLDDAGCNVYFSAQGNDGSQATYLSAPITWDITNRWHHLALTYCNTGSYLYVDGVLATNGLPVTCWPGLDVLARGFCIGSDSNGLLQAHAMFDDLSTYNYPLDAATISRACLLNSIYYYLNPMNRANIAKASSYPTNTPAYQAIAGPGYLQPLGPVGNCVVSDQVWFTNVVAMVNSDGSVNLAFTIAGGWNGLGGPFDVFANAILGPTNSSAYQWAWMGQGYSCNRYMLTNLPPYSAYLILGTPQDSDYDGLTDAYEHLVSHTDPNNPYSAGDGIPDGWKALWGLGTQGAVAGQDPDFDGLSNYQEYLYGSRPLVAEGLAVWLSVPSGAGGIP